VIGDPIFVGLRGQTFQVHGIDGQVYNLIIDHEIIINARFVFLSEGRCPSVAAPSNCWSHPGSYLGEIGLTTSKKDRLMIKSGSGQTGFSSVSLNDIELKAGVNISGGAVKGAFTSAFSLTITAGNFEVTVNNSDHFVNLVSIKVLDWSRLSSRCHGLLGQTWRRPTQKGQEIKEIEGRVDDYAEADNNLLGNRFDFQLE